MLTCVSAENVVGATAHSDRGSKQSVVFDNQTLSCYIALKPLVVTQCKTFNNNYLINHNNKWSLDPELISFKCYAISASCVDFSKCIVHI